MAIYYVDLENGNDANNGQSFADRKLTIPNVSQFDEVRVMASADAYAIGNATWTSQEVTSKEFVVNVSDDNGEIKIYISPNTLAYYQDDGYVQIANSYIGALNGRWQTTSLGNGYYKLKNSSFSSLGVSSGTGVNPTTIQQISGRLVIFSGEQVKSITPSWSAASVTNVVTAYVNVGGCFDAATNGGVLVPGSTDFVSRPQSTWRIKWSSNTAVTVEERTYFDPRTVISSWSNSYNSNYGSDNYGRSIYTGYWQRHYFGSYTGYYLVVNSNSFINIGHYSTTNYPDLTNPSARNYKIGARNSEMYRLRYKVVNSKDHTAYSDVDEYTSTTSTYNNGYLIWYIGNRQDAGSVSSYQGDSSTNAHDLEWTAYFYGRVGSNNMIQVDIHTNTDFELQTIVPGVVSVGSASGSGSGSQFNTGGTEANTTVFWENFTSSIDLSSYDSLSLMMKRTGTVPDNFKLRLHEGAYDSGASYVEVALPIGTLSSEWVPVAIDFGANLSSNIQAISIHYDGSSDNTSIGSFYISDLTAVSSTGLNLSTYIGRNTTDSPHWYRIESIDFDGYNTFVSIKGSNDQIAGDNNQLAYYGSGTTPPNLRDNASVVTDTVTTYGRSPITLGNSGITLNTNRVSVRGGWNRTDMSTQTSDTWINMNATEGTVFNISNVQGSYYSNFHATGGGTGFYITGCKGIELENCSASYCNDVGFLPISSDAWKLKIISSLANGQSVTCNNTNGGEIYGGIHDGNTKGISRAQNKISDINTFDVVIRGCRDDAMYYDMAKSCRDYNPTITSCSHNIYDVKESTDILVHGGLIRPSRTRQSSTYHYYNSEDSEVYFLGTNIADLTITTNQSGVVSMESTLYVDGPCEEISNANRTRILWPPHTSLVKDPDTKAFTLPDGSTDPGNVCWKWERHQSYDYTGWKIRQNSPRIKLGEIPVSSGTTITVSADVYRSSPSYGRLQVFCDWMESSIGITEDVEDDFYGPVSQWNNVSFNVTAVTTGVAVIYMVYFTDVANTIGNQTRVLYTNLEITTA